MNHDYEQYLDVWIDGIIDEIQFWENSVFSEDGIYHYKTVERSINHQEFKLEEDISKYYSTEGYKKPIRFLDVGSGPFSRCGFVSEKYKILPVSVDPLARVYNILKKRYNLNNQIDLRTGLVEQLDRVFSPGEFDVVHMSNSLDHAFDAIFGLYELLYVCRVGGLVILRHHENEAECERYEGFHQWNLSVHNQENSFVIWRKNQRFDVCENLKEYADVLIVPDQIEEESGWKFNKVIIRKKKDIPIPENKYEGIWSEYLYKKLLSVFLLESDRRNLMGLQDDHSRRMRERIAVLRNHPLPFLRKMNDRGYREIIIYGGGKIGRDLYELCMECGIEVRTIIDKNVSEIGLLPITLLSEFVDECIPIITTIDLRNITDKNGKMVKMISLNEILD